MNKPITESNFIALIQEHQLDRDITVGKMGEHYFELAKRMAIDFWNFYRDNLKELGWPASPESGYDSAEKLFELYQHMLNEPIVMYDAANTLHIPKKLGWLHYASDVAVHFISAFCISQERFDKYPEDEWRIIAKWKIYLKL
jgi:hypothetical protein